MFNGAKNGRTIGCDASSDLHLTTVGGHTGRGQGAGGAHLTGGGHLTSGQRARGQGGHSPASFLQDELSMITGWGLGMLLFNTYLLRSGTGGHSVFNMKFDMSGIAERPLDGICDFKIYLLKSGSIVRGQGAMGAGFTLPQPQGLGSPHALHDRAPANPSRPPPTRVKTKFSFLKPTRYKNPAVPAPPTSKATRPIINMWTTVNFITSSKYHLV